MNIQTLLEELATYYPDHTVEITLNATGHGVIQWWPKIYPGSPITCVHFNDWAELTDVTQKLASKFNTL